MKIRFSKKAVKYAVILVIVAGLGGGTYYTYKHFAVPASAKNQIKETAVKVARGDLAVTISGTGAVQPISRYDIVPLVKGNVLSAPFDEGMDVKAGDLLYKIDDSDLSFNIQKAQNSIDKLKMSNQSTQDSITNLEVVAPFDGRITNFTLTEGEQLSGNNAKIAELVDDKKLTAIIPFNEAQAGKIVPGQSARAMFGQFLTYLDGVVKFVNTTPKASDGGAKVCEVEIAFENPGAVTEGMEISAIVKTPGGDITSLNTGKIAYAKKQSLMAQSTGKVKQVLVKNGEWVKAGQKILVLENDSLMTTNQKNQLDLNDSQLSLDAQKKQLNDYNILSPISGRVIKKNYKAGDTVGTANNSTVLMTVADLTKMIFTIDVDELDVSKVALKQKVAITCDSFPDTGFEGEVTNISMEGKTSNGVTTYAVQVTISNPGKLRPGMNVKAKIQVESKKNVLYVPLSAVTKVGNKAFVMVKGDGSANTQDKKADATPDSSKNQQPSTNGAGGQAGGQGRPNNASQGSSPQGNGAQEGGTQGRNPQGSGQRAENPAGAGAAAASNVAGDRQRREVVLGINTDSSIEIVSGLQEGDLVYLPASAAKSGSTTSRNGMPGGGGGFPGGVMITR